eukprot:1159402-Pelagomonas_calceolata.AAC.13
MDSVGCCGAESRPPQYFSFNSSSAHPLGFLSFFQNLNNMITLRHAQHALPIECHRPIYANHAGADV